MLNKKISVIICMLIFLTSCYDVTENSSHISTIPISISAEDNSIIYENEESENYIEADSTVDYDITAMSATMVYGQIADLINNTPNYIDKTFKISGEYQNIISPESKESTSYIVIKHAIACCPQGFEIALEEDTNPPSSGDIITIKGTLATEDMRVFIKVHSLES